MKKSIAKKWIAALRSGEYKQGIGQLRSSLNPDSFCCLGVLCNLHAQEHPKIAAKCRARSVYMGENIYLPIEVVEWAGMKTRDGTYAAYQTLAKKNDNGAKFKTIAKIIEANVEAL